jgi:peptide deformylase
MALLSILEYPDPRLRTVAERVTRFDAELARFIADLGETLHAAQAIGIAATQVNVHWRVIAIDVSKSADEPQVFINPTILAREQMALVEEGCLSLPGIYENVKRATQIRVRTHDASGASHELALEGLAAVCLQHEMDHLEGRLFVDRLSFFKRRRALMKLMQHRRAA